MYNAGINNRQDHWTENRRIRTPTNSLATTNVLPPPPPRRDSIPLKRQTTSNSPSQEVQGAVRQHLITMFSESTISTNGGNNAHINNAYRRDVEEDIEQQQQQRRPIPGYRHPPQYSPALPPRSSRQTISSHPESPDNENLRLACNRLYNRETSTPIFNQTRVIDNPKTPPSPIRTYQDISNNPLNAYKRQTAVLPDNINNVVKVQQQQQQRPPSRNYLDDVIVHQRQQSDHQENRSTTTTTTTTSPPTLTTPNQNSNVLWKNNDRQIPIDTYPQRQLSKSPLPNKSPIQNNRFRPQKHHHNHQQRETSPIRKTPTPSSRDTSLTRVTNFSEPISNNVVVGGGGGIGMPINGNVKKDRNNSLNSIDLGIVNHQDDENNCDSSGSATPPLPALTPPPGSTPPETPDVSVTGHSKVKEFGNLKKQVRGLEHMYGQLLRQGDSSRRSVSSTSSISNRKTSRGHHRKHNSGSISSNQLRHINKRFTRLESHVVTLARSVAHLSSEMRAQTVLTREIETIKTDLALLKQQQRITTPLKIHDQNLQQHNHHIHTNNKLHHHLHQQQQQQPQVDWQRFRGWVPTMTNSKRVDKLTKFFGEEPPLLNLFLQSLGYDKYSSNFAKEGIGMLELPYMTEERLTKIGIPMGPRLRILQEAQMCFRHDNFDIYIV